MRLPIDLGDGYTLVKLRPSHTAQLNAATVRNIERLRQWEAWAYTEQTPDTTAAHITDRLAAVERGDAVSALIMRDTLVAGSIELRIDHDRRAGEIGYWLDADAVGRGLATRASEALMEAAREQELRSVRLRISETNTRSLAVARRLGFTRVTGTSEPMNVGGTVHTMLVFIHELQVA